ncbi:hypothetical protein K493DRAFT_319087 [Basidiobolus meristosporus CBS 931.73]|uniref:Uncharacterized protein n=1 Tax=Basidiobolus meristosporus CBS 931.73 TaxID=1314790 RepID=A0A1Y1XT68_9FUNG|nr:hypothetical protein K493DRAFT_319087 [Basidiobolus meristosporus CBS 931.73]|eukprot:ORX88928.1 hypothetical protein K493DRAFT_319087 [Basidiobolus meristosporus CBS 931.73]
MPTYPPPTIPSESSKASQKLQRIPSFSSPSELLAHLPLIHKVDLFPKKEATLVRRSTSKKLMMLEPNPNILINNIAQNSLTFAAVEATH